MSNLLRSLAFLLTITSTSAMAHEFTCPSLEAIKSHGITQVKKLGNAYLACETSTFGSDRTWSLFIDSIEANSAEMAIVQGNKWLTSLTQPAELYTDDAEVICYYKRASEEVLIAATLDASYCNKFPLGR